MLIKVEHQSHGP